MPYRTNPLRKKYTGTLTMDGSEQTVYECTDSNTELQFFIDLTNMQAGDTIVTRQYHILKSGGSYVEYGEETFNGAQSIKCLHVVLTPNQYGNKYTMRQTAGVNRAFDWIVWVDKLIPSECTFT